MPATATTPALDDDQVRQYREQGWVLVEDVFDDDELDRITELVEAAPFALDLGRAEDGKMRYRPMMHTAEDRLAEVCADPRWAGIVLPLVGPDARLYWEQCVAKPPGARTELPWHQDNGYTPLDPEEFLTCWLALDDADADNGGMQVLPGSHTEGTLEHRSDAARNAYFRVGYDGDDADGITVPVRRGSVLVFSSLLLHRSGPNATGRDRRAWIIQYCPAHAVARRTGADMGDRLKVAEGGAWLASAYRDREFDLAAAYASYDND